MLKSAILSSVALAISSVMTNAHTPAINPDMVAEINAMNVGWESHVSPRFANQRIEHVYELAGTKMDRDYKLPPLEEVHPEDIHVMAAGLASIPESFDAREKWPECISVIGHIRDQAHCGSCWAVSTTTAFNDRMCIASGGQFKTLLSPQDTLNCCGMYNCAGSNGCQGGNPGAAWGFFATNGVVSGGDQGDVGRGTSCMPYHAVEMGCYPQCSEYGYRAPYYNDKVFGGSSYSLSTVEQMQMDIMTHGPITMAFDTYEDVISYKSGVYKHVSGQKVGGHAVRVIGWGTEGGEDYWLIANSWGTSWGENGTFKFLRGSNECGIESEFVNGGRMRGQYAAMDSSSFSTAAKLRGVEH